MNDKMEKNGKLCNLFLSSGIIFFRVYKFLPLTLSRQVSITNYCDHLQSYICLRVLVKVIKDTPIYYFQFFRKLSLFYWLFYYNGKYTASSDHLALNCSTLERLRSTREVHERFTVIKTSEKFLTLASTSKAVPAPFLIKFSAAFTSYFRGNKSPY